MASAGMAVLQTDSTPNYTDRPRFTSASPWNAQPGLWIVTILSIIYAFSTIPIRHMIRRKFTLPEASLYLGFAFALCSYILMFVALEHGAGIAPDHLSVHEYHRAASYVFTSIIFLFLTGGCSACSQLCLLEELVPGDEEKAACWLAIAVCICSAVASAITVSAGCDSTSTLNTGINGSCPAAIPRWSAALALVMLINAIPALIPIYLFRTLRARLRPRSGLYLAFAFPLISIALAATAIHLYITATHQSHDGTGLVAFLCCLEVLLGWQLISPTIPIGRPMALRFTTHGTIVLGDGYGSDVLSGGDRFTFPQNPPVPAGSGPVSGKRRSVPHLYHPHHRPYEDEIELRPDVFMHSSIIRHDSREDDNSFLSNHDASQGDASPVSQQDAARARRLLQESVDAGEGICRTVLTQVESMRAEDFAASSSSLRF